MSIILAFKKAISRIIRPEPQFHQHPGQTHKEAYARYVSDWVIRDPQAAVGGMWEEIGLLQFDFLIRHGLLPDCTLLDVGCGTLRGGRHFIHYLQPEKYVGYDISAAGIHHAQQTIAAHFVEKKPLVFQTLLDLESPQLANLTFDFVLAQSVFTHLTAEVIENYFRNIGSRLTSRGQFFFTYDHAETPAIERKVDFLYPLHFFEELASQYHLKLTDHSADYPHPRNQRMLSLCKP